LEKKKKTNTPESSKALSNTASVIESFLPAIAEAIREAEREGNPRNTRAPNPNSSSTLRPRP
jgi:hypothetical protein